MRVSKGIIVKTISSDSTYIDYRTEKVGVRVRRDVCRPIILERGRWTEYGVPYILPVDGSDLEATRTGLSSLAANVKRVEESAAGDARKDELRQVITGQLPFDSVSRD